MNGTINKAIAAGLTSAIVALVAHYGINPNPDTISALGVLLTALVGYVAGHLLVFLAPANKVKI